MVVSILHKWELIIDNDFQTQYNVLNFKYIILRLNCGYIKMMQKLLMLKNLFI